jgi:hypothetical protein
LDWLATDCFGLYAHESNAPGTPIEHTPPASSSEPGSANIAMGACQGNANNPYSWGHPCGNDLRNGYASCNQQKFKE